MNGSMVAPAQRRWLIGVLLLTALVLRTQARSKGRDSQRRFGGNFIDDVFSFHFIELFYPISFKYFYFYSISFKYLYLI